jgi:hypothetical protein
VQKEQVPNAVENKSVMAESEPKVQEQPKGMPDFDFDFDFGEEEPDNHDDKPRKFDMPSQQEDEAVKPYFHSMYEKVSKDISPNSVPVDSKKVLDELKAHHSEHRTNREAVGHTNIIQDKIQYTLEELHKHEEEWKELHDMQHEISQKIADKEKEIEEELEKFKVLIRKLTYTKLAAEEQAFLMQNGQKIRSISQLITILPTISEEVFASHVSPERNDFSQWIDAVFHDSSLADITRKCSTRKDLYVSLKKAITINEDA